MPEPSTVLVVDDDTSMREALSDLFQSVGLLVNVSPRPKNSSKTGGPRARPASSWTCACQVKAASIFSRS